MRQVAFDEWRERERRGIISIYWRGEGQCELDENWVMVVRLWPWWD